MLNERLAQAKELDRQDELAHLRDEFHIPTNSQGEPVIYLCGNSLGLQPKGVQKALQEELDRWAREGVEGHFAEGAPWYSYHELLQEPLAAILGAKPQEVVAMNSLTANLHLLMVSFYRPTKERFKIMIEGGAFPSDLYAVQSQACFHGFDPEEAIVEVWPRDGEEVLRQEDVKAAIAEHGEELELVLFGGVNYYTGQVFDLKTITEAGHGVGAKVGFDLAHAAGNVELALHDWGCDFAAWCSYKYLNAGPGAVAGLFVHERHATSPELPRFAGWWGTDPKTRFAMGRKFAPQPGAAGWQVSNAPILSMASLRASLALFTQAGMERLRQKSVRMTEFLFQCLDAISGAHFRVITPREAASRGSQLSLLVPERGEALFERLQANDVVCDYRRPDVIRIAPVPLYNRFEELWRFAQILEATLSE